MDSVYNRVSLLGPVALERKTAALLAYLALEGPTSRSRLAGLLWPDSPEPTARNNLSQLLRRLRQAGREGWVVGSDTLSLQGLTTDVNELELAHFAGRHAEVVQGQGQLLEGLDYDDCPELEDWLILKREYLDDLRRQSRVALAEVAELAGAYRQALGHAQALLEVDPVSEAAHRRVMRLLYLLGDRGAALGAYQRCQEMLKKELGVAPSAETQALAQQIDQGERLPTPAPPRSEMPLGLLRPPRLVGREREWAQMEAALAQGQGLLLVGPPGVGKSRLLSEFLQAHGPYVLHRCRPGDARVPYAVLARGLREALARFPSLTLPDWVRRELAPLLPELGEASPSLLHPEEQRLRFLEALAQAQAEVLKQGIRVIAVDDLQFLDTASFEALLYLYDRLGEAGVSGISTYRSGELEGASLALLEQSVRAGQVVQVHLEPLPTPDLAVLLESLELPQVAGLEERLGRYTGGNPLFVLETLRSLWESGQLKKGLPERLPASGKVKNLISQRLERLSLPALNLARVASVALEDFDPVLAAAVMETDALALAGPWAELEGAQVLQGHRFVHDLIFEAVHERIPAPIRSYLHARVAAYLEAHQADPARLAGHWLEANQPQRAWPFLLEAGRSALEQGATAEAIRTLEQAQRLILAEDPLAPEVSFWLGRALFYSDPMRARSVLRQTLEAQRQQGNLEGELCTQAALASLEKIAGHMPEAIALIEDALKRCPPDRQKTRLFILENRFDIAIRSGDLPQADACLDELRAHHPADPALLHALALLRWHQGRLHESAALHQQLLSGPISPLQQGESTNDLGMTYYALGQATEAVRWLRQTVALRAPGPFEQAQRQSNLGLVLISRGQYREANLLLEAAQTEAERYGSPTVLADVLHRRGLLAYRCLRHSEAEAFYVRALDTMRQVADPFRVAYIAASRAANLVEAGQLNQATPLAAEALDQAQAIGHPIALVLAHQAAGLLAQAQEQPQAAQALLAVAETICRQGELGEYLAYTLFFQARLGQEARPRLEEALRLAQHGGLADVEWRVASRLAAFDSAYLEPARTALEHLRANLPEGWSLTEQAD